MLKDEPFARPCEKQPKGYEFSAPGARNDIIQSLNGSEQREVKKALDYHRASIILGTLRILIALLMLHARNERLASALVFGIPFIRK